MLRKYAFTEISIVPEKEFKKFAAQANAATGHSLQKVVKYNPDFVYARFRAIGNLEVDGANANHDAFPYPEFLDERPGYGYRSFEGKHAFVEHASDNINNAIGDLHAAYLNRFDVTKYHPRDWKQLADDERIAVLGSRGSHEDGSVEVLMAVDKKLAPKIARMLETGSPTGCSMGTNIDYSECSVCGNRAHFEHQYCPHIKFSKGQQVFIPANQLTGLLEKGNLRPEWLPHIVSRVEDIKAIKDGSRKMVYAKVFEVNYGLSFFELSVVANPAFTRGYKLEKVASVHKTGYRQFSPLVQIAGRPVEVILNVSEDFFDSVAQAFGARIDKPFEAWSTEDRALFARDGGIAKDALMSGNVQEVLTNKQNSPFFIKANIEITPSENPGFYRVADPSQLLGATFASTCKRVAVGTIETPEENAYLCAWCHGIYDRKSSEKTAAYSIQSFATASLCTECEKSIQADEIQKLSTQAAHAKFLYGSTGKDLRNFNDFEYLVSYGENPITLLASFETAAQETNLEAADYINLIKTRFSNIFSEGELPDMKKKAEYDGLPSSAEFTGDKNVHSREGETELWKAMADKGGAQIEKEKTYRPMGTVFVDAIVAKKDLNDRKAHIDSLLKSTQSLMSKVKLAMDIPGDFVKSFDPSPVKKDAITPPMGGEMGGDLGGASPVGGIPMGGISMDIEIEPADLPTVLQNTLDDLSMIAEDLETSKGKLSGGEEETKEVLANKKRWSKRLAAAVTKIASDTDALIDDAIDAINDAQEKIQAAYDTLTGQEEKSEEGSDKKEEPSDEKKENPFEKKDKSDEKSPESEKTDSKGTNNIIDKSKGDKPMSTDAGFQLNENNLRLIKGLRDAFATDPAAKTAMFGEKDEKKEEKAEAKEEKSEAKEEKSEKKDEKKENPFAKKEAAAMPPTGARDPGDYGHAGGIEAHELAAWKGMTEEFATMKNEELKTSLNVPDGKISLLTGPMNGGETASTEKLPGSAGTTPAIYSKRTLKLDPKKSFYTIMVKKADGSIDGFVATLNDVAGDNVTDATYEQFISDGYQNDIHAAIKVNGLDAVKAEMSGRSPKPYEPGVTPGKEESSTLYDSMESEKSSNTDRKGERPDATAGHDKSAGDKGYFAKAFGDEGYAAELVKANKKMATELEAANLKIASLTETITNTEKKDVARVRADRALFLARFASSKGLVKFDLPNIEKTAKEYLKLDDASYAAVKSHLEKLPTTHPMAVTAYQIPEAENMRSGIVHNSLNAVEKVRIEDTKPEGADTDGLQKSVEDGAKMASIVPQMSAAAADAGVGIPDVTKYFNTIENQLKRAGKYDENKKFLRSNRRIR